MNRRRQRIAQLPTEAPADPPVEVGEVSFNERIYGVAYTTFQHELTAIPVGTYLWVTLRDGSIRDGLVQQSNSPEVLVLRAPGVNDVLCIATEFIMAYQMKESAE